MEARKENAMTTAKRMSKAQILTELSEKTGLSKKDVQNIFSELMVLVERELGAKGPGEFVLPDLVKLKVKIVPEKAAHEGVDPFTKEKKMFPAKPASRKVKSSPVKHLKDLLGG
jgi:DNA-binding protein HU-beta